MKKVVYRERGIDRRELGAADLEKAGVDGFKKTVFHKGEPVEVTNEVAKVLTENKLFTGFSIVDEAEEADAKADAKAAKADEDANSTDTEAAQESTGTPRAPRSIKSSTP